MPAPSFNKKPQLTKKSRTTRVKIGPFAFAAVGVAGIVSLLVLCFGMLALASFFTMLLLGVLHAEVALGIPAFGYWASFWITVALIYFGSYFGRPNSNK